ncbi:hypothetical protein K523DRAFT_302298 [Schizophyllum commune Tattone D]|nr:hypothetical protein K525DRAFT_362281 [Schizophyllum commune Loenen D]KAI5830611.1 hypothetical protein K523DRAFT_302298 [Schizophyllum commune Tattone D]
MSHSPPHLRPRRATNALPPASLSPSRSLTKIMLRHACMLAIGLSCSTHTFLDDERLFGYVSLVLYHPRPLITSRRSVDLDLGLLVSGSYTTTLY